MALACMHWPGDVSETSLEAPASAYQRGANGTRLACAPINPVGMSLGHICGCMDPKHATASAAPAPALEAAMNGLGTAAQIHLCTGWQSNNSSPCSSLLIYATLLTTLMLQSIDQHQCYLLLEGSKASTRISTTCHLKAAKHCPAPATVTVHAGPQGSPDLCVQGLAKQ